MLYQYTGETMTYKCFMENKLYRPLKLYTNAVYDIIIDCMDMRSEIIVYIYDSRNGIVQTAIPYHPHIFELEWSPCGNSYFEVTD